MLGLKKRKKEEGTSNLTLGTTRTTAHRGDHGNHAHKEIINIQKTDYAKQLLDGLNF